jgi:hypothetical protein
VTPGVASSSSSTATSGTANTPRMDSPLPGGSLTSPGCREGRDLCGAGTAPAALADRIHQAPGECRPRASFRLRAGVSRRALIEFFGPMPVRVSRGDRRGAVRQPTSRRSPMGGQHDGAVDVTTGSERPRDQRAWSSTCPRSAAHRGPTWPRERPYGFERACRSDRIGVQGERTVDGFGDVRNDAVAPAAYLVPKQPRSPQTASQPVPRRPPMIGTVQARHRRYLDHIAVRAPLDGQGRVVEVAVVHSAGKGDDGLEDPPVDTDAMRVVSGSPGAANRSRRGQ